MYKAVTGNQTESVKLLISFGANIKDVLVRNRSQGCFGRSGAENHWVVREGGQMNDLQKEKILTYKHY